MGSQSSGGGGANQWARPVLLAVACIVIGFVIGWFARGDGGGVVLPTVADAVQTTATVSTTATTATAPTGTSTVGTTDTTGISTTGTTGTTGATVAGAPARDQINLVILNGTETTGLAAKTQAQAESIGYSNVGVGDAPATQANTVAYYRTGEDAAAQQVAADLGAQTEQALTAGSGIESAAVTVQPDVDVVLVLGG
jgi:LytR cell envelope-related transcriptional attenuator